MHITFLKNSLNIGYIQCKLLVLSKPSPLYYPYPWKQHAKTIIWEGERKRDWPLGYIMRRAQRGCCWMQSKEWSQETVAGARSNLSLQLQPRGSQNRTEQEHKESMAMEISGTAGSAAPRNHRPLPCPAPWLQPSLHKPTLPSAASAVTLTPWPAAPHSAFPCSLRIDPTSGMGGRKVKASQFEIFCCVQQAWPQN